MSRTQTQRKYKGFKLITYRRRNGRRGYDTYVFKGGEFVSTAMYYGLLKRDSIALAECACDSGDFGGGLL